MVKATHKRKPERQTLQQLATFWKQRAVEAEAQGRKSDALTYRSLAATYERELSRVARR